MKAFAVFLLIFSWGAPRAHSEDHLSACMASVGSGSPGSAPPAASTDPLTDRFETLSQCERVFGDLVDAEEGRSLSQLPPQFLAAVQVLNGRKEPSGEDSQPLTQESINRAVGNCAAIYFAMAEFTEFRNPGGQGMYGPMQGQQAAALGACPNGAHTALDYQACTRFMSWFNALTMGEQGLNMYNQNAQGQAQSQAQRDYQQASQSGQAQTAGLDASRAAVLANAESHDRRTAFYAAQGAMIMTQLQQFPSPENFQSRCQSECCKHLATFNNTGSFFPNQGIKQQMMAEVVKAAGNAIGANMQANASRKQADMLAAAKKQVQAYTDTTTTDSGLINYCQANPLDSRCATEGTTRTQVGVGQFGADFGGLDAGMGSIDFNNGTGDDAVAFDPLDAVGGSPVGNVGDMNQGASDAKDVFNPPGAGGGGGGGAAAAGGSGASGGSAGAASAPGLSKDPAAETDQKPAETKVTSTNAKYDGAAYAGAAWKPSGPKKDGEAAANPFSALFKKDDGRGPAAVEIDAPASDLFTKISNRYSEVQKRKGLLDLQ